MRQDGDDHTPPGTIEPVKIVVYGMGTVATSALELCRHRTWLQVVGAIRGPEKRADANREVPHGWEGVTLWPDPDTMLDETQPDLALIATRSPLGDVVPDIERCIRRGVHVICTSEELAWPDVEQPGEAARLQEEARRAGVSVVATGINPGFVFDTLPLTLAAASWDVRGIHVVRVLDASVFGRRVHRSLGIGYTEPDFHRAVESRDIRGHIGFAESAQAIAAAMGVDLERFEEHLEPVPADRVYELRDYTIRPPQAAGVTQNAVALADGREWLRFDLSLHVNPVAVGMETHDRIHIIGDNDLDLTIKPGTHAVKTTAALLVNTIPSALAAPPGFYAAAQLPPAPPWLAARPPG
jgi:4-hydroxy-tetrahydrodipicolinate reductase